MAYFSGKNVTLSVNSQSIGAFCSNITLSRDGGLLDVTTFGDSDREFLAGIRSATIQISGYFDSTASTGPDAVLSSAFTGGAKVPFSLVFGVGGSPTVTYAGNCWVASYETASTVDGLITFSATLNTDGSITRT